MTDDELAESLAREWLRDPALRPLPGAMNSSAYEVRAGRERYVLKVSSPADEPGLHAATCLEANGFRAGGAARIARRNGRLVALLHFVEGRPLSTTDWEAVGESLGSVHRLLGACAVPSGITRWPWTWLDTGVIGDGALRSAATAAIERVLEIAPALTHGILHGDPAPEAFHATPGDIGLIDWGAVSHGPLLYDVASAWMYTERRVVSAYARTGPLAAEELEHASAFLAFRWAVQAWYFSIRLASGDLTGISDARENEKGLADARRALLPAR